MPDPTPEDRREQLAHMDAAAQAEIRKFVAEHAGNVDRQWWQSPWVAALAIVGGIGGAIDGLTAALRVAGVLH